MVRCKQKKVQKNKKPQKKWERYIRDKYTIVGEENSELDCRARMCRKMRHFARDRERETQMDCTV